MQTIYKRQCPKCSRDITYGTKTAFNRATKLDSLCQKCAAQLRLAIPGYLENLQAAFVNIDQTGSNNPFYGRTHSDKTKAILKVTGTIAQKKKTEHKSLRDYWTAKFGAAEAERLCQQQQAKLSKAFSGDKNPMYGKPSPQGSGNGWSGWYKGWYFRSLIELSYVVSQIEANSWRWKSAEAKELKMSFIDWDGKQRSYFADFLVNDNLLVECKPKRLHSSCTVLLKQKAALDFCSEKGYTYLLTDCPILKEEDISRLHKDKKLVFTDRYEIKFMERTKHVKL